MTKRNWARLIVLAVVIGLLVVLMFQNIDAAPVSVLFWQFDMSKSLMLILAFVVGAIVGIIAWLQISRTRRK